MSKKLLTIFSLLLIFFCAMSCNNKSTDSTGPDYTDPIDPASIPLKDSQYVGKWYEETSNDIVCEIKQDGSIDLFDQTQVLVSASGTDVTIKEGDAVFKAVFSANGQTAEIVFTFTSAATGSMTFQEKPPYTISVVKK
ncbi:hypothetical protein [Brachyspira pilosicoli]|uniref:Lipocalin-like domain-containing protein n=1 Tax=Brachyspira pilosicoli TaxID=52584 RepID=A0A5C8F259_BRAPL|nr:hypothetical protein [Brachyspira pilosicoli]TXJ43454.1 hypothetical protein EPJ72_04230 [Brachyspira pilosicoli]